MKPAETIFAFAAQLQELDDFDNAVRQAVSAYGRTFEQIRYHVTEFSELCKRFGRKRLMAALPAPVQTSFNESLGALRSLWESQSPFPFPELPDEPLLQSPDTSETATA